MESDIVLASASPRRTQLLQTITKDFIQCPADVDETPSIEEPPESLVTRLSYDKAHSVQQKYPTKLIIGSDTVVTSNATILGKPKDFSDFLNMMKLLSGTTHEVFTGVCVLYGDKRYDSVVVTQVNMSEITESEAFEYWHSNEPADKAGGYAIQGIGGKFVVSIDGSFSSVVGLPLYETKQLIEQAMGSRL